MKKLTAVILSLVLVLSLAASMAEEKDSYAAITVDSVDITAEELKAEIELSMFIAAIDCAGRGYVYDTVDRLNIEDETDKVIFSLEIGCVIRIQAEELGVGTLTPESEALAREITEETWNRYVEIAMSENGLWFLPAGDYEPAEDPGETLVRYFASFGLTKETLYSRIAQEILEDQLKAAVIADMDSEDEESVIMYYTDWILERMDETYIREDEEQIAAIMDELEHNDEPEDEE